MTIAVADKPRVFSTHDSPIGPLLLSANGGRLCGIGFPKGRGSEPGAEFERDDSAFNAVRRWLDAYFEGARTPYEPELAPAGTTFQRAVWDALRAIPYGTTVSYGAIAQAIGRPSASRAVGAANGANPIPIIVPCHRVIGANGDLTGFGGGLPIKEFLLALEGARPAHTRDGQTELPL